MIFWLIQVYFVFDCPVSKPSSGRVDSAPATETVDTGWIPGRVKPNTTKTGIHSCPAWHSPLTRKSVKPTPCVVDRWQFDSKSTRPIRSLLAKATCQINVITITTFDTKTPLRNPTVVYDDFMVRHNINFRLKNQRDVTDELKASIYSVFCSF